MESTAEWRGWEIIELKVRTIEITESKIHRKRDRKKKKKRMSLRDLWDYNKRSNSYVIRVAEEEKG